MPPVPTMAEVSPIELDEISLKVEVLFSKGSELARTHKLDEVMASWLFIALATCYCDLAIYCQSQRGYCELAIYCLSSTSYCEMAILLPELDELLRDGHFIARARLVLRDGYLLPDRRGCCELADFQSLTRLLRSQPPFGSRRFNRDRWQQRSEPSRRAIRTRGRRRHLP